jgi:hypothetical protein
VLVKIFMCGGHAGEREREWASRCASARRDWMQLRACVGPTAEADDPAVGALRAVVERAEAQLHDLQTVSAVTGRLGRTACAAADRSCVVVVVDDSQSHVCMCAQGLGEAEAEHTQLAAYFALDQAAAAAAAASAAALSSGLTSSSPPAPGSSPRSSAARPRRSRRGAPAHGASVPSLAWEPDGACSLDNMSPPSQSDARYALATLLNWCRCVLPQRPCALGLPSHAIGDRLRKGIISDHVMYVCCMYVFHGGSGGMSGRSSSRSVRLYSLAIVRCVSVLRHRRQHDPLVLFQRWRCPLQCESILCYRRQHDFLVPA